MSNFKKGDWVRDLVNGGVVQLTDHFNTSGIEHWTPKVGDWCWFKGIGLVKIIKVLNNYYTFINIYEKTNKDIYKDFAHAEPFIGQLPTHIKEN